jgi:selenocysteine lyase/cysteine desulfurase
MRRRCFAGEQCHFRNLGDPAASPHIISLGHPRESVQAVVKSLRGLNIVGGIRGGRIRISLAPYNDASDVNTLIEAFARVEREFASNR